MALFHFKNSQQRTIRYFDNLNKTGIPVLFFHGFPGSYEQGLLINYTKQNIRFISFDRPGLGGSDFHNESSFLSFAKDIEELINHLDLKQVRLLGISGGAPYTLATAYHLQERVEKVSLICPLSPLSFPEVFSLMPLKTQKLFSIYKDRPFLAQLILKTYRKLFLFQPDYFFNRLISKYPEVDRKILSQPHVGSNLLNSFKSGFSQGVHGLSQDLKNYLQPLDYDFKKVTVPVDIWHGTDDNVVPHAVGEWYGKNLSKGCYHLIENEGHFSLPYKMREQILSQLLENEPLSVAGEIRV